MELDAPKLCMKDVTEVVKLETFRHYRIGNGLFWTDYNTCMDMSIRPPHPNRHLLLHPYLLARTAPSKPSVEHHPTR